MVANYTYHDEYVMQDFPILIDVQVNFKRHGGKAVALVSLKIRQN